MEDRINSEYTELKERIEELSQSLDVISRHLPIHSTEDNSGNHTCALAGDMAIFTTCATIVHRLRIVDYRHTHCKSFPSLSLWKRYIALKSNANMIRSLLLILICLY